MEEKNKYLMEDAEAEQLLNHRPDAEIVSRPPVSAGQPPDVLDRYQGGVLSSIGLQTDTANSQLAGKNPVYRLMPATIAGNPAQNAAVQSVAAQSGGGGILKLNLALVMPSEFGVTGSPITKTPGEFDVTWEPEDQGTVFSGPPEGAVGFDASFTGSGDSGAVPPAGGSVAAIVGGEPSADTEFAMYIGDFVGGSGAQSMVDAANWTTIPFTGGVLPGNFPAFTQQIPSGSTSVTAAVNYASGGFVETWTGALLYFGGLVPSFIQGANANTDPTGLASAVLASPAAGNALLVIVRTSTTIASGSVSVSVTDTQNLTQASLASSFKSFNVTVGAGLQQDIFLLTGAANSAETVNVQISGAAAGASANVIVVEMTPPVAVPARPRFRLLPPPDLSKGTGVVSNANGGTGANLSATGGASQVLKQATTGAVITVGVLAASDLSNGTVGTGSHVMLATTVTGSGTIGVLGTSPTLATPTWTGLATGATLSMSGKFTKYNNINIVSNGVPAEYATVDTTNATANVAATTAYAVPAGGQGMYRISYYLIVNRVATTSSALPDIQFTWTDPDNSTLQTVSFVSATPTTNTLTTRFSGDLIVFAKLSTNIQYQTGANTAYASVGGTTMQYSIRIKVEAL